MVLPIEVRFPPHGELSYTAESGSLGLIKSSLVQMVAKQPRHRHCVAGHVQPAQTRSFSRYETGFTLCADVGWFTEIEARLWVSARGRSGNSVNFRSPPGAVAGTSRLLTLMEAKGDTHDERATARRAPVAES